MLTVDGFVEMYVLVGFSLFLLLSMLLSCF